MKKIFSFLCMFMAMTAMISCSSSKEEKGTTGTGNAALDNIFERKYLSAYSNGTKCKEVPSGYEVFGFGRQRVLFCDAYLAKLCNR